MSFEKYFRLVYDRGNKTDFKLCFFFHIILKFKISLICNYGNVLKFSDFKTKREFKLFSFINMTQNTNYVRHNYFLL